MIKNMENWNSNVNENIYGENIIDDIVENIKDEVFSCQDCQWTDSCKNYLSQILSDPDYDIKEIEKEVNDFKKCDHYSPIDELDSDNSKIIYDRDEYRIEYNTYLNEFYNG